MIMENEQLIKVLLLLYHNSTHACYAYTLTLFNVVLVLYAMHRLVSHQIAV